MKRIDGKNNRLVTFSNHTSIEDKNPQSHLYDVDVAVIIFSAREKLYETFWWSAGVWRRWGRMMVVKRLMVGNRF
ncbi:hypothetical protein R6Q59_008671 [Mikania micrantha]